MVNSDDKTKLKKNLELIKDNFLDGRDIVLIHYALIENSMILGDDLSLEAYLENLPSLHNPVIMIFGNGGNLYTGLKMSYLLRAKFENYGIFVPLVSGSALNYLIFKSNQLMMTNSSVITQIDPIYQEKGLSLEDSRLYKNCGENNNYIVTTLIWHKYNAPPLCNGTWIGDIEYVVHIRESGAIFQGNNKLKNKVDRIAINKMKYGHPTEKPLSLINKYIKVGSNEGDIILDPFIGSGTTAESCFNLKRNFIGFEIDEEYYKIAINRLENRKKQGSLKTFF